MAYLLSLLHMVSLLPAGSLKLGHWWQWQGLHKQQEDNPSAQGLLQLLPLAKSRHRAMPKVNVGGQ